jgi:DNA-binding transcriptional MerR regulator
MPDVYAPGDPVQIPNRTLFKAGEVCDLVKVQPYVLRSWEAEFPELGVAKAPGGPRVYRRTDVERVVRIKHLLLVEGLTLAGARRRLEEETPARAVESSLDELIGRNARERITEVKRGLRAILDLLSRGNGGETMRLTAAVPMREGRENNRTASGRVRAVSQGRLKTARPKARAMRRKRSA